MWLRAGLAVALVLAVASPSVAGTRTKVTVQTYSISGNSGEALVNAMDRNGPRQGFVARAIAQTRYAVDWRLTWRTTARECRLVGADAGLSIGYRFPAPSNTLSPTLKRRWARFMVGVRRHEETHGRLARDMVAASQRSIKGVAIANDPSCRATRREVERRVKRVYADYEQRQLRFDETEHREGGHVDRLLTALIGLR